MAARNTTLPTHILWWQNMKMQDQRSLIDNKGSYSAWHQTLVGSKGERQSLKFTEPRASLWKILPIFRHVKQYTWNIWFSSMLDQNESSLLSGRYMTVYVSVNTEFIILPLFDGNCAKENFIILVFTGTIL